MRSRLIVCVCCGRPKDRDEFKGHSTSATGKRFDCRQCYADGSVYKERVATTHKQYNRRYKNDD